MPNYKLVLEYNGENFNGSQIQNNDQDVRTVQGELEKVLSSFLKEDISTTFSGRTDKGVHAIGQVVNFHSSKELEDLSKMVLSFNSQLAEDLVIVKMEEVDDSFNARFDAKSREYLYKLFVRRQRPVLRLDSLAWFKEELDFEAMQEHCKNFLGKQDFAKYCKEESLDIDPNSDKFQVERTTICEVYEAELIKESKLCYKFRIKADRFLRNMVRRMVGELVQVGKAKPIDDKSSSHTAPAAGLSLIKVEY